MGLFGGGRAATAEQTKRAEQERALLNGVVMHVAPSEFRASSQTMTSRSQAVQPSVAITAAQPPPPPAPRPPEKISGAPKSALASLVPSKKLLILWGGVAVLAIGGTVGVLVLIPSPQQLPPVPVAVPEPIEPIVPIPAIEEPPVAPPAEEPPQPRVVLDSDGDGVSDPEEALYGSDATKFDTDGDGYSDQLEIVNLYNPAGTAPVRLVDSGSVVAYTHPREGFSLLMPRVWVVERDESAGSTRVRSSDDAFVEITIQENAQRLSAETWYRLRATEEIAGVFTPLSHENSEGVWTPDRSAAIVTKSRAVGGPDRMAVIRVDRGEATPQQFETTWTMIVRSFQWTQ